MNEIKMSSNNQHFWTFLLSLQPFSDAILSTWVH